jgi:hypothetical protein
MAEEVADMKRIFLTAAAASTLALAVPAGASAHHSSRHHGARHVSARTHHHLQPRIVTFGAPVSTTPAPASSTTPPVGPPTTPGEAPVKVASFTNGLLTITLSNGSSVSGMVTNATELECQAAAPETMAPEQDGATGEEQHGGPGPSDGQQHDEGQGGRDGGGDGNDNEASGDGGHGEEGREGDNLQQGCPTGALVAGAVVREAELSVNSTGSIWDKVELAG